LDSLSIEFVILEFHEFHSQVASEFVEHDYFFPSVLKLVRFLEVADEEGQADDRLNQCVLLEVPHFVVQFLHYFHDDLLQVFHFRL
jgi:hypothetical protein